MNSNKSINNSVIAKPIKMFLIVIYLVGLINIVIHGDYMAVSTFVGPLIVFVLYVIRAILWHGNREETRLYYNVSYIVEILILLYLFYTVREEGFILLFTVMAADGILFHNTYFAIGSIYIGYIIYRIIENRFNFLKLEDFTFLITDVINYSFMLAAVVLGKNQILQNLKLKEMSEQLKAQSKMAEELAVVRERNRIAGDMHDTVGHKLSLAIIELEAGKAMFNKDANLALEKMVSAREQVSNGLEEIRRTIESMKDDDVNKSLTMLIEEIINESSIVSNLDISSDIQVVIDVQSIQKKMLTQITREALTNVIKHSASKEVKLSLIEEDGLLYFQCASRLSNDTAIKDGFGLTNMKERFKALGGQLEVRQSDNSLVLKGFIPIGVDGQP